VSQDRNRTLKLFEQNIADVDAELLAVFEQERGRQRFHLEMIASENYTSRAVIQAMGSILTNKYAEGYPGKRYYGGCEFVDVVENFARDRARELFRVPGFTPHVNVQSHSGASANQAVFLAFLKPGDKILGCSLPHGGHLTHGSPANLSGKWFQVASYGVSEKDERIDMNVVRETAKREQPKMIIAGFSSYSRTIDFKEFRSIADEVGALLLVDMAHIAGLVATGLHPSPFPHAHVVTTTTHKTLRGPRAGMILCAEEFAKKIDSAVFPGLQGGPLMHVIAGKAVCFKEALRPEFKSYATQVVKNAAMLARSLEERGFRVVSGGTDNHLLVCDLTGKKTTGKEAETALDAAGINANRNTIPYDKESPFVTSGMRLGSPALTTRGFMEEDMVRVADLISRSIDARGNPPRLESLREEVHEFGAKFPIYACPLG